MYLSVKKVSDKANDLTSLRRKNMNFTMSGSIKNKFSLEKKKTSWR